MPRTAHTFSKEHDKQGTHSATKGDETQNESLLRAAKKSLELVAHEALAARQLNIGVTVVISAFDSGCLAVGTTMARFQLFCIAGSGAPCERFLSCMFSGMCALREWVVYFGAYLGYCALDMRCKYSMCMVGLWEGFLKLYLGYARSGSYVALDLVTHEKKISTLLSYLDSIFRDSYAAVKHRQFRGNGVWQG